MEWDWFIKKLFDTHQYSVGMSSCRNLLRGITSRLGGNFALMHFESGLTRGSNLLLLSSTNDDKDDLNLKDEESWLAFSFSFTWLLWDDIGEDEDGIDDTLECQCCWDRIWRIWREYESSSNMTKGETVRADLSSLVVVVVCGATIVFPVDFSIASFMKSWFLSPVTEPLPTWKQEDSSAKDRKSARDVSLICVNMMDRLWVKYSYPGIKCMR